MEKDLFDIITEYAVNEGMNDILLNDDEYIEIQNEIEVHAEQFDKLDLGKEECLVVDRLITSHVKSGAYYGKMTYKKGFRDCVALLQEMNLIKAS